jgi:hypothetical protein
MYSTLVSDKAKKEARSVVEFVGNRSRKNDYSIIGKFRYTHMLVCISIVSCMYIYVCTYMNTLQLDDINNWVHFFNTIR